MLETRVWSLGREILLRRKWQLTPVLLPGKSHGQRSLAGYSPWGRKELDTTEQLYFTLYSVLLRELEAYVTPSYCLSYSLPHFWVLTSVKLSDVLVLIKKLSPAVIFQGKFHIAQLAKLLARISVLVFVLSRLATSLTSTEFVYGKKLDKPRWDPVVAVPASSWWFWLLSLNNVRVSCLHPEDWL